MNFDEPTERAELFANMTPEERAAAKAAEPGGGGGPNSKYFGGGRKVALFGHNLFGEEIKQDQKGALRERFDFPPFTVLNAREGAWQERKRAWLSLGIQSEVGRGENLLKMSDTVLEPDPVKRAEMQARRGDAKTYGSGGPGDLAAGFKARAYNDHEWMKEKLGKVQAPKIESANLSRDNGVVIGMTTDPYQRTGEVVEGAGSTGTSIFDPVLCELSYKWFCPPGGLILDPFAGGSVRGLVAGILGYRYYGIELRQEQVEANEDQRQRIAPEADIRWVCGDSNKLLLEAPEADFVFSCPPYGDLEVYSDDPNDLSAMTWEQFAGTYRAIIRKAVARLKPNRFAAFVVGEYRDKKTGLYRGFIPLTTASFMAAGADYYNKAILVTSVGSLPIRVTKQFEVSRKLGHTHQDISIHVKGDPRLAAAACSGQAEAPSALQAGPDPALALNMPAPILPPQSAPAPAESPVEMPFSVPDPLPPASPAMAGSLEPAAPSVPEFVPVAEVPVVSVSALEFAHAPQIEVGPAPSSLAEFLKAAPLRTTDWKPQEPPNLAGVKDIILNFETNGLNWAKGDRPIGLTVGSLDGKMRRYLPFAHQGGDNLPEERVKEFAQQQIRDKNITNIRTSFDVHMADVWGIDLEAQGNTVSDIAHYAALLDDHRKKFALDVLAQDYLGEVAVMRVDERNMAAYAASEVAARAEYQAELVAKLRAKMWPELDKQNLQKVRQLEDDVIYPVVEMERNGAQLDVELCESMQRQCAGIHDSLMREIIQEVGFNFELTTSGWQRLFEHCGLPPQESYAEDVIDLFNENPLIAKAERAKQYASLNSKTFAAYLKQVDSDGVLRFDINQLKGDYGGTESGRFSIGYVQQVPNHDNHHVVFGQGEVDACIAAMCNLFPRRVFIPRTGQALSADAAQIEYRIFAHFAGNPKVLEAYRADPNMSFHKYMWPLLRAHKPDMLYSWTKNYNFMVMYGGGLAKKALMMGHITKQEFAAIMADLDNPGRWNNPKLAGAKEIQAVYEQVMPETQPLIAKASHLAKSKCDEDCKRGLSGRHSKMYSDLHRDFPHRGYVMTIEGRRSRFPNNWKTFRGLNRVIQGSAADVNKRKIVELHRAKKHTGLLMRLTVHDEIMGDAQQPETEARVSEILNTQSFPQLLVPIVWAVKTGKSWAECK